MLKEDNKITSMGMVANELSIIQTKKLYSQIKVQ